MNQKHKLDSQAERDADLLSYMTQREAIRCRRAAGESPPWTDDPTLQRYRFTNIDREYDAVTIWIRKNWREPHADDPYLWFAMVVARHLNLPDSLKALGYPVPWNPKRWTDLLMARAAAGVTNFNAAYIVGTGSKKASSKVEFLAAEVLTPMWNRREQITRKLRGATLAQAAYELTSYRGLAGFLAGQIIADLKHTPVLRNAFDWWTWAASGPGSRRGMNRLLGRPVDAFWDEGKWLMQMHLLRGRSQPRLKVVGLPELCAQNWQHNLCEADKFWRALSGEGKPKQRFRTPANDLPSLFV